MNVGKAIYYLLANNANVSAITTRIYPEFAPPDATTPFIAYTISNVQPDDTHDGPAEIDEVRMDVICVDDTYNGAADLASVVRVALDRVYGTYNTVNVESIQFTDANIEVRDTPRQYGQDLTFIVRVKRDDVQIATGSPIEALNLWRLADVDDDIVNALDRQALVYDEATSQWIADGVGQVVIPVRNPSRDPIAIGTVLKATGAQGDRILVAPFEPATDDMKYFVGITSETLAGEADGHAQVYGELRKLDTDDYEVGDVLYAAAGGTLSTIENQYPIAIVTRKQQNTGRIFIRMWTPGKGYHQRYRTQASAKMFVGVGATVELYYTATADGDGFVTQDLTAAVGDGNVEERVLRYKSGAFGDTTVLDYTDAGLATDATYAEMLTAFNNLLATEGAPITIYATRTEVAGRSGLLADYPGAAAAYSLRLLDTDYTGSAVRVRRASDNAEQDIGFDGNGDLDTTALATFCSGTDGFVKTWYDQSGNANDATQTTTGSQPKIYDSATGVVVIGGNPAVLFDGVDDEFIVSHNDLINQNRLDYFAHYQTSDNAFIMFTDYPSRYAWAVRDASTDTFITTISPAPDLYINGSQVVIDIGVTTRDDLHTEIVTNGASAASGALESTIGANTTSWGTFGISAYISIRRFSGKFTELVFYKSAQDDYRAGIESNINDYYSIYP
jgi:hypothetical protein